MSRGSPSLAGLLTRSYAAVLVPVLVAMLVGLAGQVLVNRERERLDRRIEPLAAAAAQSLQLLTDAETGSRGFQLTGNPDLLQPYRLAVLRYPEVVRRARAADPAASRLLDGQDAAAQRWIADVGRPAAAGGSPDPVTGKRLFDQIRLRNLAVTLYVLAERAEMQRRTALQAAGSRTVAALLALVAVGLAVRAARRATAALTGPVNDVVHTLGELTHRNFAARAGLDGPRELRTVAKAVNELGESAGELAAREAARRRGADVTRAVQHGLIAGRDQLDVLQAATAALGAGMDVDRVYVRLVEDGRPGAALGLWPPGVTPFPDPPQLQPSDDPLELLAVQAVADVEQEPDRTEQWRSRARSLGVRAYLNAPLRDAGEIVGYLSLQQSGRPRPWTDLDREVAATAGREIALALAHARTLQAQRAAVERLTSLDLIREEFVSTVSHELRTPLTSISGYLELLHDAEAGPVTPTQQRMLDIVDRNVVRLRALIDDLLTLSSIDADRLQLTVRPLELAAVVESAVAAMRSVAAAGSLTLSWRPPATPLPVVADQDNLERALLNLLSNAVKYTPAGGTVTVTADGRDGRATVTVTDTGIGIPAEDQEKLFERFFRASNAREANLPGTGLGLALVRELVVRQGGAVTLTSEQGVGTTVTIRLPIRNAAGPGVVLQDVRRSGTLSTTSAPVHALHHGDPAATDERTRS